MPKRIAAYKKYITREGDTFDALALAMYKDETRASDIIQFNRDYANVVVFEANIELRLPIFDGADSPETLPPWRKETE